MTTLAVDVWSDLACPWCYLGKHRLAQAVASSRHADLIVVRTRSFELNPGASSDVGSNLAYLESRYGLGRAQVEQAENRIAELAREAGLDYVADRPHANSFDAHRAVHLARSYGLGEELFSALQDALFGQGTNVYDRDVIREVATGLGVPDDRLRDVLAGTEFTDDVRRDEAQAARLGVTGVPFTVVGGRYAIPGAATVENYREVIDRAAAEG